MRSLLLGLLVLGTVSAAHAERSYADHGCNVVLRRFWFSSGGRAGWSFVVDVRESMMRSRPVEGVGVLWRLQNQSWSYFPLSRYTHPHMLPGWQSYVGYFDHQGHPSMYLDAVAVVASNDDRIYDHNFESGDVGFSRADRSNHWSAAPGERLCR